MKLLFQLKSTFKKKKKTYVTKIYESIGLYYKMLKTYKKKYEMFSNHPMRRGHMSISIIIIFSLIKKKERKKEKE